MGLLISVNSKLNMTKPNQLIVSKENDPAVTDAGNNKVLVALKINHLKKSAEEVIGNATVNNEKEFVGVIGLLLHNLASVVVPGYAVGVGTIKDYYDQKVNKKRQQEIDSLLEHLNRRLASVELRQEAVDYFETSIVFQLEEITRKLLTNPGRGFDELIAEFVASALQKYRSSS